MGLKNLFEKMEPAFLPGGKYSKLYPIFESIYTLLYTPGTVTHKNTHVRDALDSKRMMITVFLALFPAIFYGMYNVGNQAIPALNQLGNLDQLIANDWHYALASSLGLDLTNNATWGSKMALGAIFFLPIYLVVFTVCTIWELLFSVVRGHEVNEGMFVSTILFALIVPPTLPLWQAALGISFGIVVAKEIFGGVGRNFMNPALAARCFLLISFAGHMTNFIYDGVSSATPLAVLKAGGEVDVLSMFIGTIGGTIGETSVIAILIGAAYLLIRKVISIRIPLAYIATFAVYTLLFGGRGFDLTYLAAELCGGGLMLGAFFMATDYVTSPITKNGKIVFGIILGILTGIFRFQGNSAEGVSYAIIFSNLLVPIIEKLTAPTAFGIVKKSRKAGKEDK